MASKEAAGASKDELVFTFPEVHDAPPDGQFFTEEAYKKYSLFAEDIQERPASKVERWLPSLEPLEPFSQPLADKARLHTSRPSASSTPAASQSRPDSGRIESQGACDGQAAAVPLAGTSSSDASHRAGDTSVAASHIGNFEAGPNASKHADQDSDDGVEDGGWAHDDSDWGLDMPEEPEGSQAGPAGEQTAAEAAAGGGIAAAGATGSTEGAHPPRTQKRGLSAGSASKAPPAKRARPAAAGEGGKKARGRPPKPAAEAPADVSQATKRKGQARAPMAAQQAEWARDAAVRPQPAQRRTDWNPQPVRSQVQRAGERSTKQQTGAAVGRTCAPGMAGAEQRAPDGDSAALPAKAVGAFAAGSGAAAAAPVQKPVQWSKDMARGDMARVLSPKRNQAPVQAESSRGKETAQPKLSALEQARLAMRKSNDLNRMGFLQGPAKPPGPPAKPLRSCPTQPKATSSTKGAAAAPGPKKPPVASKAAAAPPVSGEWESITEAPTSEREKAGKPASRPPTAAHVPGAVEEITPGATAGIRAGSNGRPASGKGGPKAAETAAAEEQQAKSVDLQPAANLSAAEKERLWGNELKQRKHSGQKAYEEHDLFNPNCPVFDPYLERDLKALQRVPGPVRKQFGKKGHQKNHILSCLTKQQHAWYMKNTGKLDRLTGEDAVTMQQLQADIVREQAVWLRVATRLGSHEHRERLLHCDPLAAKQIEADAAAKRARVQSLPQHYRLQSNLHLEEVRFRERAELKHEATALCEAPQHAFQPVRRRHLFSLVDQYLPPTTHAGGSGRSTPAAKAATAEMSQDPQVLSASLDQNASVCAPACALSALAGLLEENFGPAWEIPVTVKELTGPGGSLRRLVILDKPLVKRASSRREQHSRLFKWALLSVGLAGRGHAESGAAEAGASLNRAGGQKGTVADRKPNAADATTRSAEEGKASHADVDAQDGAPGEEELAAALEAELDNPTPKEDTTLGPDTGPDVSAEPACENPNSLPVPGGRAVRLDVWELGRHRLLVRSHSTAALPAPVAAQVPTATASRTQPSNAEPPSGPTSTDPAGPDLCSTSLPDSEHAEPMKPGCLDTAEGQPVVVRSKLEYHGQRFERGEMVTDGELARWWLAALLRPGASVWVGRVGITTCRCLSSDLLSPSSLNAEAAAKSIPARFAAWLKILLDRLSTLKVGRYHVTHGASSLFVSIFQAAEATAASKPLPLDGAKASAGTVFDLWAAHQTSGAADPCDLAYVPLSWKAPDDKIPQIPYTFNPRPNALKQKRHRTLLPSFITQGPGGGADWDEQQGKLGNFSKAHYAEAVYEEL